MTKERDDVSQQTPNTPPKPITPKAKVNRPPLTKAEHAAHKRIDKNVIKRMRKR